MDNLVYEESMTAEQTSSEFISKKWMFVNDNNVGNYSNQVVIDTTPLANAGAYVGWNEAYILMPLVVQLTASTPADLPVGTTPTYPAGSQSWAFKNGFWQMIHSMSVEFNNGNAVSQFPFLNVFASFKAQTSFSEADVFNHGDGIGFYMDNSESFTYQSAPQPQSFTAYSATSAGDGVGLCNNKSFPEPSFVNSTYVSPTNVTGVNLATVASPRLEYGTDNQGLINNTGGQYIANGVRYAGKTYPNSDTEYNMGMRQRQKSVCRDYNQTLADVLGNENFSYTGQEQLMPISSLQQVWATGAIANTTQGLRAWNIYAKLRLKDLSDFFHKVPLLKGATMRFIMNTNQAITSFSVFSGTNTSPPVNIGNTTTPTPLFTNVSSPSSNPIIFPTNVNVVGGMTNPLMIASNAIGQGCNSLAQGTYQLSVSIVKCNFTSQGAYSGLANTALQSCRLYAPLYKFDPMCEARYLSQKTKKITYKDVVSYQFTSIPSQNNFNVLVSQGLKNICSVLTVPLIASGSNGINPSTGAFWGSGLGYSTITSNPSTLLSPFTTTGATPDPIILNNYNVQIAGVNQFLQDEMYDFEAFKHQLIASNQLNGNLTTGLTSGLINEKMFSYLYRYYYANCERELPTVKSQERSIQVKGRNLCSLPIDLLVFVEYEREMMIDIETGQRVG